MMFSASGPRVLERLFKRSRPRFWNARVGSLVDVLRLSQRLVSTGNSPSTRHTKCFQNWRNRRIMISTAVVRAALTPSSSRPVA